MDSASNKSQLWLPVQLNICYFNGHSIVKKLTKLQNYVYSSSIDVLIITETWLNDSIFNNEILPDNYTIYHRDRDSRGGGVLLAIRDCIPSKLLFSSDNSKVITVQLCAPKPVVLCTAYLPPHSTLADAQPLFDHLSSVCSGTMPVIAIGDYNLPGIDWETLSGDSLFSNIFCDLVLI